MFNDCYDHRDCPGGDCDNCDIGKEISQAKPPTADVPVSELVNLLPSLFTAIDDYIEAVERCGCSTASIYTSRSLRAGAKERITKLKIQILDAS